MLQAARCFSRQMCFAPGSALLQPAMCFAPGSALRRPAPLRTTRRTPHVARRTPHVARRTSHVARRAPHVARRTRLRAEPPSATGFPPWGV